MGIRILLYHSPMFADFALMLHKLASSWMAGWCIPYVKCMQKNAEVYHYLNFKINI